ncbi:hypothetical protein JTB14_011859 [Gonioctena quinquepunctata]|nr:hypothetical protein JTB14_011859 [Gonioctena quinquepunctata]
MIDGFTECILLRPVKNTTSAVTRVLGDIVNIVEPLNRIMTDEELRKKKEAIDLIRRDQVKQRETYNQERQKSTDYQPGDLIVMNRGPPPTGESRKLALKF